MMKKSFTFLSVCFTLIFLTACSDGPAETGPEEQQPAFEITGITIPASYSGYAGDEVNCWAKGLKEGDVLTLSNETQSHELEYSIVSDSKFFFIVPDDLKTGYYDLILERDGQTKLLRSIQITILVSTDVPPKSGKNVKGVVHVDGQPVSGVVVSDGYDLTVTDADGCYWLESAKEHGYVFISVPSGYECNRTGVLPAFFQFLSQPVNTVERLDFELNAAADQTNHRLLVFGDMHLANRSNRDIVQFGDFVADVNEVIAATTVPVYGLTLGDMTFDSYWYSNSYFFSNYLSDMSKINGLAVYNTIGNHDHEMGMRGAYPAGDFATAVKYKLALGPTYYSFNIGDVHYVVLDDIYNTNDGSGSISYEDRVTTEQLDWLKKDLSYVDKSKTIVIAAHAQFHNKVGEVSLDNYSEVMSCFEGFENIHIFTGHSHLIYNVEDQYGFEHNSGAVCATWWWTGYHSDIHIAQDGAPGGYTIVDFIGGEPKWQYKGTGHDIGFQFRCYDGNAIQITADLYCPDESSTNKSKFNSYASYWSPKSSDNYVYINVWNWDPEWKIEVTEDGVGALDVTQVSLRDPLHLIAYTAPSIANPTFATSENHHYFRVQASKANSTLQVKVTDRFGNVYTETMTRPRPFNIVQYK